MTATPRVALVDYGMGNIHSAGKALERAGSRVVLAHRPEQLERCDRVVLPGVGSMLGCITPLRELGFVDALRTLDKPLLAICVGMQLLFEHSEENNGVDGLGLLSGSALRFSPQHQEGVRVPHIGWNRVDTGTKPHPLWAGIADNPWYYFVHSYRIPDSPCALGTSDHGGSFVAAAGRDNIFATQFHPEKSHANGLRLLSNFLSWG